MIRATWNGAVLAQSDETVVVEGSHYFPVDDVDSRYLRRSDTHTRCPWKGTASYYTVEVDGEENPDAAWYYPDPSRAARKIAGRIAFWHGVKVEQTGEEPTSHADDSHADDGHADDGDAGAGAAPPHGLLGRLLRR